MNGTIKFHKASSPAFNVGEVWYGSSASMKKPMHPAVESGIGGVTIVKIEKYPGAVNDHSSDYGVTYEWSENGEIKQHTKDAWNFQVRYTHRSDYFAR